MRDGRHPKKQPPTQNMSPQQPAAGLKQDCERHSRSRRRLLQSLAAGGAAVTVKSLPDRWAKPALETSIVPAHAQASIAASLTCEIDVPTTNFDGTISFSTTPATSGPWLTGGQTGTIDNFALSPPTDATVIFDFYHLEATVTPANAGPIILDVDASPGANGGYAAVNQGANQTILPNASGVVDFGTNVVVGFSSNQASTPPNPSTASVNFNFNAAGQDCVINVVFAESFVNVDGP